MGKSAAPPLELCLADEDARLLTLADLDILDTPPEREFDAIVACARRHFGCKIALFSLVDETRQWFKAKCGLDASETPRSQAFCAHAIREADILVVEDARLDPRFAGNDLVLGPPHIRFYAGAPIRVAGGGGDGFLAMGTLCIIDDQPRSFGEEDAAALRDFAQLIQTLLNARAELAIAKRTAEDRRDLLEKIDLTHWQFRQAERMANMGCWRLTLADNRVAWSDQVYAIHGLPVGDDPPLDAALRFYPHHARAMITTTLTHTARTGEPFDIETDFLTARGETRRIRTIGELEMQGGRPHAIVGVFQDVTARFEMEEALRRVAATDALTGLANRSRFNAEADRLLRVARADKSPMALLLIDLDHFKMVNDRCGHLVGDDLLRTVGARLTQPYLSGCFAARLGGDEFVLIVTADHLLADLPGLIRRLLVELCLPIEHPNGHIAVSGTIGATWVDRQVWDKDDLLHRADEALYTAKEARRGTACIHGSPELIEQLAPTDDALSSRVA